MKFRINNFNFEEILKLIEINKILESEIRFLEKSNSDLFSNEPDESSFLKFREDYKLRFDKFKYLIFCVIDIDFESDFILNIEEWKNLICKKENGKKNYYFDIFSLNNFIIACLPGKYQTKVNKILWSYLEEYGYNEGFEKIKELISYIKDKKLRNDIENKINQYELLKNEQNSLIEKINSKNYFILFKDWVESTNDKDNQEEILNSVVDFLSYQKFQEEKKDIDLLFELVFDKLEEIKYGS